MRWAPIDRILDDQPSGKAAIGRGCVKTRKNSAREKIDRSERSLRDLLDAVNGQPTDENFVFCVFTQPWPIAEVRRVYGNHYLSRDQMILCDFLDSCVIRLSLA